MRRIPLTAAAMAFLALPGVALAGSDVSRTLQFLGFNADGTKYLLKVSDADTGDFLSLRNFATAKQEKAIPIEAKKQEKKLVEDAKKQFKIVDKGKEDMASPDGRFTFSGMCKGEKFFLKVAKGNKTADFQTLKLETGRGGTPARVDLKSVFWAQNGKNIVVILHRKLVDENGVDADEVHPYEFFAGGLNFK